MLEHNNFCADFILFIFTAKAQLEKALEKKKEKKGGKATSLDLAEGLPNPLFPPGLVWPSAAPGPVSQCAGPATSRARDVRAPPSSPLSGDWAPPLSVTDSPAPRGSVTSPPFLSSPP